MSLRLENGMFWVSGEEAGDFFTLLKASWKKKRRPTNKEIEHLKVKVLSKMIKG